MSWIQAIVSSGDGESQRQRQAEALVGSYGAHLLPAEKVEQFAELAREANESEAKREELREALRAHLAAQFVSLGFDPEASENRPTLEGATNTAAQALMKGADVAEVQARVGAVWAPR